MIFARKGEAVVWMGSMRPRDRFCGPVPSKRPEGGPEGQGTPHLYFLWPEPAACKWMWV